MKIRLIIQLKKGVLDPQGKAISHALHNLSYQEIQYVRVGRVIDLELSDMPVYEAKEKVAKMARDLLANSVIENFEIEVLS